MLIGQKYIIMTTDIVTHGRKCAKTQSELQIQNLVRVVVSSEPSNIENSNQSTQVPRKLVAVKLPITMYFYGVLMLNNDFDIYISRKRLLLEKPDIPTRSRTPQLVDSEHDQYLEFTHSDFDADAAQSTVPFIDIQAVLPNGGNVIISIFFLKLVYFLQGLRFPTIFLGPNPTTPKYSLLCKRGSFGAVLFSRLRGQTY